MTCFMCRGDMENKRTTFMVEVDGCIIKDINRFKMIIDKNTFEIVRLTVPKSIYTSMARKKIKDILKSGEPLPEKVMSCWC